MTIGGVSAFMPRATPDDLARLRILEASIEILKTENEILNRRLAAAETSAAQAVITLGLNRLAAVQRRRSAEPRATPLMAPLLVRFAGSELMTERDSSRSKISWNWDRVLLVLALVAAIGFGLDQHWADEKIIAALTLRCASRLKTERDAAQAEKAAVESVSFEAFKKQYNAHVAALKDGCCSLRGGRRRLLCRHKRRSHQTQPGRWPEREMSYTSCRQLHALRNPLARSRRAFHQIAGRQRHSPSKIQNAKTMPPT